MKSLPRILWLTVLALLLARGNAQAQLAPPNGAGVAMGSLQYRVRDVEANKRFWIALGGQAIRIGGVDVLKFPGVLVFLTTGESSGGTEGAVLNHVAFRVPTLAAVEARGFMVQRLDGFPGVAYIFTPEGERVELFEDAAPNLTFTQDAGFNDATAERHNKPAPTPVAFHHIHFYVPENAVQEVKAWYVKMFGGVPGKRSTYDAVDLPGINFNISGPPRGGAPTRGRMLDRIGLEVRGLDAFCARLATMGVRFDVPYKRDPAGFSSAVLTDPWGVTIELTEGLRGF